MHLHIGDSWYRGLCVNAFHHLGKFLIFQVLLLLLFPFLCSSIPVVHVVEVLIESFYTEITLKSFSLSHNYKTQLGTAPYSQTLFWCRCSSEAFESPTHLSNGLPQPAFSAADPPGGLLVKRALLSRADAITETRDVSCDESRGALDNSPAPDRW